MTLEDLVLVELHRAAALAGRPGIAVPSQDLDIANNLTDSRARTQEALGRLARKGRLTTVRKDLLLLPGVTGRVTVGLDQLIDTVAPEPYLITGWSALEHHRLTDQHYFSVPVLVPTRVTMLTYREERAIFLDRLVKVLRRFRSAAAARRVGLLVDRLFGTDAAAPFRGLIGQSRTPVLLRRGGLTHGHVDPSWRVIVNAGTDAEEHDR